MKRNYSQQRFSAAIIRQSQALCFFFSLCFSDFSRKVRVHPVTDFGLIETMAKEEHKFGYCTFGSTVVSADDACLQQFQSGFVASHFDYATLALSDVDNNDATFCGVLQLADEPFLLRSISRTECFEYNRFQTRDMENRIDDAFLDTGKRVSITTLVSNR